MVGCSVHTSRRVHKSVVTQQRTSCCGQPGVSICMLRIEMTRHPHRALWEVRVDQGPEGDRTLANSFTRLCTNTSHTAVSGEYLRSANGTAQCYRPLRRGNIAIFRRTTRPVGNSCRTLGRNRQRSNMPAPFVFQRRRVLWSQNRHTTANQHLSGPTSPDMYG
jgi:hypothetical protein